MNKTLLVFGAAVIGYVAYDLTTIRMYLNKMMNHGELAGVEQCMSLSNTTLVSEATLRNACAEDFHVNLFDYDLASGRAGPRERDGAVYWEGRVRNGSADYVTTWGELSVDLYDADGEKTEFTEEIYLWIEPQSDHEFSAELRNMHPTDFENYNFCDLDAEEESFRSCMAWGWDQLKGLKI